MAQSDPSTREMVRSTLSHEVRGLLVNLAFHLDDFEDAQRQSGAPGQSEELNKFKAALRKSAVELNASVSRTVQDLRQAGAEPGEVFKSTDVVALAMDLLSRTQTLRRASPTPTTQDAANTVHRTALNIERMIKISNSLFGGDAAKPPEPINPLTIMSDIAIATPAQHRERVRIARPSSSTFRGYRRELISATTNLIRNSLKYAQPGVPPSVHVSLSAEPFIVLRHEFSSIAKMMDRPVSPSEIWLHVSVKDNGRGIPEELLNTVFRPFVRVSDDGKAIMVKDRDELLASEDSSSGQGFGLTLVKRVAELHGGVAIAKNLTPHGLAFGLMFPFVAPSLASNRAS